MSCSGIIGQNVSMLALRNGLASLACSSADTDVFPELDTPFRRTTCPATIARVFASASARSSHRPISGHRFQLSRVITAAPHCDQGRASHDPVRQATTSASQNAGSTSLRKARRRVSSLSRGCRMIQVFTLPRWGATSPGASPAAAVRPIGNGTERGRTATPFAVDFSPTRSIGQQRTR